MSDRAIIQVEGLGKRYQLGTSGGRGYTALRDVLTEKAAAVFRRRRRGTGAAPSRPHAGEFWALRDVAFAVKRGEVLGIIGRNGAGKSTLLKILSRITEPTEGRITLRGRVASLLEVGTGFHPELTGRENIYLNGAILGMSRVEIKAKFDEIVAFAEVERFLDTPVKRYSSGMYVRLAFAVAAHLEPEILIVDEVLAVGDAEFQKKCLGKMEDVAKGGRTVLFVSHQMASVANLSTRILWLEAGRVRAGTGSVGETIRSYLEGASNGARGAIFNRPSWAKPLIRSVGVTDLDGNPRARFALGEGARFELTFACPTDEPLRRPVLGIVINHTSKGTVAGVNTRMTGLAATPSSTSAGKFVCTLEDLKFLQGTYTVDFWLGDGPGDVDLVTGACQFVIEDGDVYGTGQVPFADLGVVYLEPEWQLTVNVETLEHAAS